MTKAQPTIDLDAQWQATLKEWIARGRPMPIPPCPNCGGEMVPWDAWLVTGETCKNCQWNSSEGGGCLASDPYQ